jgi:hypothetical protein
MFLFFEWHLSNFQMNGVDVFLGLGIEVVLVLFEGGMPVPPIGRELQCVSDDLDLHVFGCIPQKSSNAIAVFVASGDQNHLHVIVETYVSLVVVFFCFTVILDIVYTLGGGGRDGSATCGGGCSERFWLGLV